MTALTLFVQISRKSFYRCILGEVIRLLRCTKSPLSEQLETELAAEDAVASAIAGEETHGKHSGREAVAHLDIGMDMMSLKR